MTMRLLTRLKLRSERGMALPLAVLVMATTGAMLVTVVQYSSSSGRTANIGKGRVSAQALAEAGVASALAELNNPLIDPQTSSLLGTAASPTLATFEGGTATYWGTYVDATNLWTITAVGSVPNPTGGAPLTRTLTRKAQVHGLNSGSSVGAWNRMYHDNISTCLTIENLDVTVPIASRGDMCLVGTGKVTGATTTVEVGDDVFMTRSTVSLARSAGTGTGVGWATPTGVTSSDGTKANDSIPLNSQSANLDATSFGFAIPDTAAIVGIEVDIERMSSTDNDYLDDEDVFLLKGGSTTGIVDHASTSRYPSSDAYRTYGSASDLWGTTWTPAQINTQGASGFGVRLKVDNDHPSQARTAYIDHMQITVYYRPVPTTSIGVAGTNVSQAHIFDRCTFDTQTSNKPCTTTDKVYATTIDNAPAGLNKPEIDMDFWYENARPGPKHPCTTVVGTPPVWDNNTTYDMSNPVSDTWSEVTPTNRSYTCQVHDYQNNLLGELSWNHSTHVLTIKGTIFVDGDFRFDDDGQIVHYVGRGIIYAARDIEFDELVCAGGTGVTSCVTGGMSTWDPSQNMMTVLAGDDSEFDQGNEAYQPVTTPSGLQGIIYARDDCWVHQNFHLSGPIICDVISFSKESSSDWQPTIYAWPPLGALTEGQAYGDPDDTSAWAVTAGDQYG
jgi:hypothetical protein